MTAMGQVFHSLAKSLIGSESSVCGAVCKLTVCLPCVHIRVGDV